MENSIYNINNENKDILNILRCNPLIEKTVLAKQLNIAFKTLQKQLEILSENGFIKLEPQLELISTKFFMCGISVGGSHCKLIIVDACLNPLSKDIFEQICENYDVFNDSFFSKEQNQTEYGYKFFETPDNRITLEIYLNKILSDILKLYDLSASISASELSPIISIGIALTGSIDSEKQTIVRSHNIDYLRNVSKEMLLEPDILQNLKQRQIEVIIDHNAKAMAVCEKFSLYRTSNNYNSYKGKKNIVCLYLGSGIGCGIILNNRLIRGCNNFSGELGHVQVPRYPELYQNTIEGTCTCGAKNCLEHLIINDVFEMDRNMFKNASSEYLLSWIENIEITDKEKYIEKMKILGYYIGWSIDSIAKILNVGLIIFSGKMTCFITKAWPYIKPAVGELDYTFLDFQMILSQYGALAPSIGAAILSTYPADELVEWKV